MNFMETTPAPSSVKALLFQDTLGPNLPATECHRINWFIHEGTIGFEMECLHEKFPEGFYCAKDTASEDSSYFIESYSGERAPLRDCIITSRWEGRGEDSELHWKYVSDPAVAEELYGRSVQSS